MLDALGPHDESPHVVTRGRPPMVRNHLSYLAVLVALNFGLRRNEILSRGYPPPLRPLTPSHCT